MAFVGADVGADVGAEVGAVGADVACTLKRVVSVFLAKVWEMSAPVWSNNVYHVVASCEPSNLNLLGSRLGTSPAVV